LGTGSTSSVSIPTPVATGTGLTTTNVKSISVGYADACVVTTAGRAYCWGENGSSQLADGTTNDSSSPVAVSTATGLTATNVASISAGYNHVCAVTTAKRAYCWGNNSTGRLGDGTTTARTTPTAVSAVTGFTTSNVSSVSTHNSATCAVTTAGGVFCWGSNTNGQLGDGTTTSRSVPTAAVGLSSGVASVSLHGVALAAGQNSCAVKTTGVVFCWGYNGTGQVGDGTTTVRLSPVQLLGT
jgi:alpha-tubulin suppressor-like RCC1 family protein